ncbi:packaged DNA stabilization protein [Tolumonas lignilytica]|uniref:packaged DNA stabilization protein n=1 Tax=Tolumonas lignilytica TaxID=1283284 RepID=UPI00046653CD|nr:packaged DNA stabilization protein [Tolumonas lignilytica]
MTTRLTLTGGFYEARSYIADAQRCLNLYPEINDQNSESQVTHYPTPGKTLINSVGAGPIRMIYQATTGNVFVVSGNKLFVVDGLFNATLLQTMTTFSGQCYAKDNGNYCIVVDGSVQGYRIKLSDNTSSIINSSTDSAWKPAQNIAYMDGYFICNVTGTSQWFLSDVQAETFTNDLYFASKEGYSDKLSTIAALHREVWLIGEQTCEVFYNAGNSDFPFSRMPGVFIQHGCAAPESVAQMDLSLFLLSKDQQGQYIVHRIVGYQAVRISTHAVEEVISQYAVVSDAIGFCYQQEGHHFYVLTFPSADATWVYDLQTGKWHERGYMDNQGVIHRDISNCHCVVNGVNHVGDYSNGNIYRLDINNYTDNGQPIMRLRSFPTLEMEDKRVLYGKMTFDMQVGIGQASGNFEDPQIFARWSDDRGVTWGTPVPISLGKIGNYKCRPVLWRSGIARGRVFEVSWSFPCFTALNGAWLDYKVVPR